MDIILSLLIMILTLLIALGALALLLRLTARWVLGCWVSWGQALKTVLITLLASLILQFMLGLMAAVYYQGADAALVIMETSPGFNLLMFIASMLVQSYIYGHWLSCDEFQQPPGLGKGLLIFWAQVLIMLGLMILAGFVIWQVLS